ncbi:hypothetical protein LZG04_17505 [Saccharothrix sp. S26]|uniref:hypothetical protein n=1 Tax=Saccharothrix sp. S26 TaxID=2907215 RepID=UPI001F433B9D|nr:hypothetical protein [Saccharothrix sp. S26]MCE6996585.1 hypothetical protein [Saccharothrix sp. S26]
MNKRSSVALVAVLLVGCTAEAEVPQGVPETGLLGALAGVRATDESSLLVEYGEVAAVRGLLDQDARRFAGLRGYGYSDLAGHSQVLPELVGFDPAQATTALRVGQSPTWVAVVRMDVDVAVVEGKVQALGGRKGGSGVWTTGEDGEIDPDGPLAQAGIVTGFQQVRVEAGSVAHSTGAEALKWVTEPVGGKSLAADPMIGELARCLGEVSVAVISKPRSGLPVAAGVRVAVGGEVTEVVCVPDENPNALKDLVRTNLEGAPWVEVLAGATAEQPADQTGMVRVLVPAAPDVRVGRVLVALQRGELPGLFG